MFLHRAVTAAVAMLMMLPAQPVIAQQEVVQHDSLEAQLRSVLRSFYFNLAHHDWEAIAADVLSAKIVASRPIPATLEAATRDQLRIEQSPRSADDSVICFSSTSPVVEQAAIQIDGDWAAVAILRCGVASSGTDKFRLIHFENRWRFVYIDSFEEPVTVSAER